MCGKCTNANSDDALPHELVERKIPTLPTFPTHKQLDGKNFSTWSLQMEAILETNDMLVAALQQFDKLIKKDYLTQLKRVQVTQQAYQWD